MGDLAEFLRARILQEEALERDEVSRSHARTCARKLDAEMISECACHYSQRALADYAVQRRIIHECERVIAVDGGGSVLAGTVLSLLAISYAEHPDYREEWRPLL